MVMTKSMLMVFSNYDGNDQMRMSGNNNLFSQTTLEHTKHLHELSLQTGSMSC